MSEPAASDATESLESYFERRAREAAVDIGADVVCDRNPKFLLALFRAGGLWQRVMFDRAAEQYIAADRTLRDAATELVDRQIRSGTDLLYAATHTDIPHGAVWMMRGSQVIQGEAPADQPIARIDRMGRTYQRAGDPEPRPWPPVVFYASGRRGYIEYEAT